MIHLSLRGAQRRSNPVIFLLILFFLAFPLHAAQLDTYPFNTPAETERFNTLINEIRCVVCQGQSIADSNALLANDLKEKIYRLIKAKQSDAEIKQYLVQRYGEFILLEPAMNQHTWFLWAFPFLGLFSIITLFAIARNRVISHFTQDRLRNP